MFSQKHDNHLLKKTAVLFLTITMAFVQGIHVPNVVALLSQGCHDLLGLRHLDLSRIAIANAEGRFRTRKVSMKGFKVVNYISFPSRKLCLAQVMQPLSLRIERGGPYR